MTFIDPSSLGEIESWHWDRVCLHLPKSGIVFDVEGEDGWRGFHDTFTNRYTIWQRQNELRLEVHAGSFSMDDLLWDVGLKDEPISRAVYQKHFDIGAAIAEPHVLEFAPHNQFQLQQFVKNYCDGQVFTHLDIKGDASLGLVFMPVLFGALYPDTPELHAAQAQLEPAPEKPTPPKKPVLTQHHDPTTEPAPPVLLKPDPDKIREIYEQDMVRRVIDVADLLEDPSTTALEAYHQEIETANAKLLQEFAEQKAEWERQRLEAAEAAQAAFEVALADWNVQRVLYLAQYAKWLQDNEIHHAQHIGFKTTVLRNLGVLYEYLDKAGPRSINGNPCFFSMHIMSASEWRRCMVAIEKELARRNSLQNEEI